MSAATGIRPESGRSRLVTGLGRQVRLPLAGAVGAVAWWWVSLTPSLLPRGPVFQGVVGAVSALAGYGLGSLLGWILRRCGVRLTDSARRRAWRVLRIAAVVGTVLALVAYVAWENQLRDRIGVDRMGAREVLVMLLTTGVLFVALLVVARIFRFFGRMVGRGVGRFLPARVATAVGTLVVAVVAYLMVAWVVSNRVLTDLDAGFMAINHEFSTDVPAPTNRFVSGGPRSDVTWDDLGRQGRVFVANAPTRAQISSFTGRRAKAPVRAYVGVGTDGEVDLSQEATRAVGELERLGGFKRSVLNVVTGTGTGWVNENQAKALEYMWDGDTATVSVQYSYLPSWLSFIVDRSRAQEAGRLLFDDVYAHWLRLPARSRPRLVVSGESLGSFGGEAAFSSPQELADHVDGALFVGPTNDNPLWSEMTANRAAGTPEVLPVYHDGTTVRFADKPPDFASLGPWSGNRIGYLQHPNDPVTWWNWSLAWDRPDWLSEPRSRDVSPYIQWIPGVTMLQVATDMLAAGDVPVGQGHRFGQEPVFAWASILPPPDWTSADSARLADDLAQPGASVIR